MYAMRLCTVKAEETARIDNKFTARVITQRMTNTMISTMTNTSPIRIGLLLCDDVDVAAQDEYGTYADMFARQIHAADDNMTVSPLRAYEGELPDSPDDFDAFMISGSRHATYDSSEWIAQLHEFVRRCFDHRKKTVGICFGHQLIAHALGGEARKSDVGWGVGIHTTRITAPQTWMDASELIAPNRYNLIVVHQDQVVKLPPDSCVIAENDFCPISMFVTDDVMLGIQGHPEFSKKYCEFRIHHRKKLFSTELYEQSLASLEQMELDALQVFDWITRFIRA